MSTEPPQDLDAQSAQTADVRGDIYRRLGIDHPSPFRLLDRASARFAWRTLGTVDHAPNNDGETWATITVELAEMPARFFRITVAPQIEDVQAVTLETGSGDLGDFWPAVLLFAGGMMHAKATP